VDRGKRERFGGDKIKLEFIEKFRDGYKVG
jgi:hypothetical protein